MIKKNVMSVEDFKYLMETLRNELEHWTEIFEESDDREAQREMSFWERTIKRFAKYE